MSPEKNPFEELSTAFNIEVWTVMEGSKQDRIIDGCPNIDRHGEIHVPIEGSLDSDQFIAIAKVMEKYKEKIQKQTRAEVP